MEDVPKDLFSVPKYMMLPQKAAYVGARLEYIPLCAEETISSVSAIRGLGFQVKGCGFQGGRNPVIFLLCTHIQHNKNTLVLKCVYLEARSI